MTLSELAIQCYNTLEFWLRLAIQRSCKGCSCSNINRLVLLRNVDWNLTRGLLLLPLYNIESIFFSLTIIYNYTR